MKLMKFPIFILIKTLLFEEECRTFENERVRENSKLKQKLDKLTEKDFTRQPSLVERRASQSQSLNLPVLPTTTIGSFPQTAEVRKVRLQNKRGELSQADYDTFLEEKIKECLKLQEDIGLDVLVHGEFERNDMVEYFGEKLEGYVFTQKHGFNLMGHVVSNLQSCGLMSLDRKL